MDTLLPAAGTELLSQGLLGVFCIFLVWVIGRREQELKDVRSAHKVEVAEKEKLIQELQESRLQELKLVLEAVNSNTGALLANKVALEAQSPLLNRILEALASMRGKA